MTLPEKNNKIIRKIAVSVLIIVIAGWIAWVCDGLITGKTERAAAAMERSYIGENIREMKEGIRDLKRHFNIP